MYFNDYKKKNAIASQHYAFGAIWKSNEDDIFLIFSLNIIHEF